MPTRPPVVAGRFYPASPAKLDFATRNLLLESIEALTESPVGLIAPHAGWLFSGPIAADAFRQAEGHRFDLIVIFGTNHTSRRRDSAALPEYTAFTTPLGSIRVASEDVESIVRSVPACIKDDHPHDLEHSIEVQLPFVQIVAPGTPILPIVVGLDRADECRSFGAAVAHCLQGKEVLFIASSDLSHYPPRDAARSFDLEVLDAVVRMDFARFDRLTTSEDEDAPLSVATRACGRAPILALLGAMEKAGATAGVQLSYANSGDTVFGESDRVVGYGAVSYYRNPPAQRVSPDKPAAPTGEFLLRLARRTLEMYLGGEVVPLPRESRGEADKLRGAFVTLYKRGELRGCVGRITQDNPLRLTVGKMALAAAMDDWRFTPVEAGELPDINIEVSVLTEPKPVSIPDEVNPGVDGVVIRRSGRQGVFLPKVAADRGWSREELLEQLCDKAGLPRGSWRKDAELLTFQAEVYSER